LSAAFVRLAVLGDPLRYTRSPQLHQAGLAALGIAGESLALPTPRGALAERLRELASGGWRGCNLTVPLKEQALGCVARLSDASREARSVNTVGFEPDGDWGDTTDGAGFVAWLARLGRDAAAERVHLLGAGGAARSLARALRDAGAAVTASAREPGNCEAAWRALGHVHRWRSGEEAASIAACSVLAHATPLEAPQAILPPALIPRDALVVDLRYGPEPTAWVRAARELGRDAHDGLGMLVHQARASLALWIGRPVPLEPLERAVGWTR
jgi:shikimate dehydrogenase